MIEKPITESIAEDETLIEIARDNKLVLKVGHIERFNSVMIGIVDRLDKPRFLESTRLAEERENLGAGDGARKMAQLVLSLLKK